MTLRLTSVDSPEDLTAASWSLEDDNNNESQYIIGKPEDVEDFMSDDTFFIHNEYTFSDDVLSVIFSFLPYGFTARTIALVNKRFAHIFREVFACVRINLNSRNFELLSNQIYIDKPFVDITSRFNNIKEICLFRQQRRSQSLLRLNEPKISARVLSRVILSNISSLVKLHLDGVMLDKLTITPNMVALRSLVLVDCPVLQLEFSPEFNQFVGSSSSNSSPNALLRLEVIELTKTNLTWEDIQKLLGCTDPSRLSKLVLAYNQLVPQPQLFDFIKGRFPALQQLSVSRVPDHSRRLTLEGMLNHQGTEWHKSLVKLDIKGLPLLSHPDDFLSLLNSLPSLRSLSMDFYFVLPSTPHGRTNMLVVGSLTTATSNVVTRLDHLDHPNLKELVLSTESVAGQIAIGYTRLTGATPPFLCSRIQKLAIHDPSLPYYDYQKIIDSYPSLQEFSIVTPSLMYYKASITIRSETIRRLTLDCDKQHIAHIDCPALRSLTWQISWQDFSTAQAFIPLTTTHRNLSTIYLADAILSRRRTSPSSAHKEAPYWELTMVAKN